MRFNEKHWTVLISIAGCGRESMRRHFHLHFANKWRKYSWVLRIFNFIQSGKSTQNYAVALFVSHSTPPPIFASPQNRYHFLLFMPQRWIALRQCDTHKLILNLLHFLFKMTSDSICLGLGKWSTDCRRCWVLRFRFSFFAVWDEKSHFFFHLHRMCYRRQRAKTAAKHGLSIMQSIDFLSTSFSSKNKSFFFLYSTNAWNEISFLECQTRVGGLPRHCLCTVLRNWRHT